MTRRSPSYSTVSFCIRKVIYDNHFQSNRWTIDGGGGRDGVWLRRLLHVTLRHKHRIRAKCREKKHHTPLTFLILISRNLQVCNEWHRLNSCDVPRESALIKIIGSPWNTLPIFICDSWPAAISIGALSLISQRGRQNGLREITGVEFVIAYIFYFIYTLEFFVVCIFDWK